MTPANSNDKVFLLTQLWSTRSFEWFLFWGTSFKNPILIPTWNFSFDKLVVQIMACLQLEMSLDD